MEQISIVFSRKWAKTKYLWYTNLHLQYEDGLAWIRKRVPQYIFNQVELLDGDPCTIKTVYGCEKKNCWAVVSEDQLTATRESSIVVEGLPWKIPEYRIQSKIKTTAVAQSALWMDPRDSCNEQKVSNKKEVYSQEGG